MVNETNSNRPPSQYTPDSFLSMTARNESDPVATQLLTEPTVRDNLRSLHTAAYDYLDTLNKDGILIEHLFEGMDDNGNGVIIARRPELAEAEAAWIDDERNDLEMIPWYKKQALNKKLRESPDDPDLLAQLAAVKEEIKSLHTQLHTLDLKGHIVFTYDLSELAQPDFDPSAQAPCKIVDQISTRGNTVDLHVITQDGTQITVTIPRARSESTEFRIRGYELKGIPDAAFDD
jgi:hypothetical protein